MATCRATVDDHCCWIAGTVCEFLTADTKCGLYDQWGALRDNPEWVAAPIGHWFADRYPGYECKDWPQNIPEVMDVGIGLCCWKTESV
jgi:hypothetical protein